MEGRALRLLDAMHRPGAALRGETRMAERMPVARGEHRHAGARCRLDSLVQHRHHLVASGDGQGAPRTEVRLDIDDNQGVPGLECNPHRSLAP